MRLLFCIAGIALMAFGVACLSYTYGNGFAHHSEWATEHRLPAPSRAIFLSGVGLVAVGAAGAGFALGRRKAMP